jgi:hypothetical protein
MRTYSSALIEMYPIHTQQDTIHKKKKKERHKKERVINPLAKREF